MPFADLLLHIESYPDPTPEAAIDHATAFAAVLGAKLSALAIHVDIRAPQNKLADYLIGLSDLANVAEARSLVACRERLEHFRAAAAKAGVFGEALIERAQLYDLTDRVALRAQTRDLCLLPVIEGAGQQRGVAEAVIFGPGRPALVYRAGDPLPGELRRVVVAWDGSRCAARALHDALPLLAVAREVRVLTVLNEKPGVQGGAAADAVRHLAAHGIEAEAAEVDGHGRRIGQVFDDYLAESGADLLVMGAYGHSRVREFVLGGATEHMLDRPGIPLFLSH